MVTLARGMKVTCAGAVKKLLKAAEESRLYAFIVLLLLAGIRSEEARALMGTHELTCA